MTEEQAQEKIKEQLKREDSRLIRVVMSLFLVISGTVLVVFCAPAGIAVMAAGIIMMTITVRHVSRKTIDIDAVYEKYILPVWLSEYFDDVTFGGKNCLKPSDISEIDIFKDYKNRIEVYRSFSCRVGGMAVRACEVTIARPSGNNTKILTADYGEPEFDFWGRLFEVTTEFTPDELQKAQKTLESKGFIVCTSEDKLYFTENLYDENGPYPVWLPAPNKDSCDMNILHDDVRKEVGEMKSLISSLW